MNSVLMNLLVVFDELNIRTIFCQMESGASQIQTKNQFGDKKKPVGKSNRFDLIISLKYLNSLTFYSAELEPI